MDESSRETTAQRRRYLPSWMVVFLAGCGGGGGTVAVADIRLAEAVIGPEGGTLEFPAGRHAGVALHVPPGAVAAPTRFSIEADVRSPQILSLFPLYRFEPRAADFTAAPVTITVALGDALFDAVGDTDAVCFLQSAPGAPWHALLDSSVDLTARTATATTSRLGDLVAWNGILHRLMTQELRLLDPSVPTAADNVAGVPVTLDNGSVSLAIGRGSLQSFWNSPAPANVLIVPGLIGSPLDFLGPQDLIATLSPAVQNIVLLDYPSGRGVAAIANALYDEIVAHAQPGCRFSIVGHSMGGLIGRYLIEKSADDPARAGWREEDESLAARVANLVLLGVPNAGSEYGDDLVASLLPNVPPAEVYLLQAALDISYRPDAICLQMNASYVDNATRYHVIFGDVGGGTDGVVSVVSALALPLFPPETAAQFFARHDELHTRAGGNGITSRIDLLLQAP